MDLSTDEQQQLLWGREIEAFLKSDAWTHYAQPAFMQLLHHEFPDPKEEGWEDKYRKAFALTQAANTLNSLLTNLVKTANHLQGKATEVVPDIDQA